MNKSKGKKNVEKMSFEAAMTELEEIVEKLENGSENLDSAIKLYERGVTLKQHCDNRLKDAKLKIEKITKGENGKITLEEIDIE